MRYRPLGSSELSASVIAFGGWAIGGWNWGGQDEQASIRAIHAAIDSGVNLIDTAPVYGFGRSEEVVGKAIAGRRDKVLVATKAGMRWDTTQGKLFFRSTETQTSDEGEIKVHVLNTPESVRKGVEESLKRLNVSHIDLIQTHWQDETTRLADTMGELMRLKQEGKVRAIGACNASMTQLEQYRAAGELDCDQERYSMIDRWAESERLAWCQKQGVAFLAYSPLANGLLTGMMGPERTFPPGDMRNHRPRFRVSSRGFVSAFLKSIKPIADAHGATLSQTVLAWTIAQPGVSHALAGARTEQQARENAEAGDIILREQEVHRITELIGDLGDRVGAIGPYNPGNNPGQ